MMKIFFIILVFIFSKTAVLEDFISIKNITDKANLRKGPGDWYPIKWIIETPNLPLKILEKGDRFNKVELHDGTQGWLSKVLTSKKNNLIVLNDTFLEDKKGTVKAKVLKNNIIKDFNCNLDKKPNFCKVNIQKINGFIDKTFLWGH